MEESQAKIKGRKRFVVLLKESLIQIRHWREQIVAQAERHQKAYEECLETIKEYDVEIEELKNIIKQVE